MKSLIAVIIATLILASCATLSKSECQNGEWQATGYNDASRGLTPSRFKAHAKACAKHGIAADNTLYTAGYQDGLKEYCQVEVGILKGRKNEHYKGVCPAELEDDFLYGYLEGLDIALHNLDKSYTLAKDNLINARYRRQRLDSPNDIRRIDQYIHDLQIDLQNINIKHSNLKATIAKWSARI